MNKIRWGNNFIIFLLFFGVSSLEAITSGQWVKSLFWLAIGFVFLLSDKVKKQEEHKK